MHLVSRILQPPKWLAGFRRANRTRRKGHLAIGRDLERLEERQLLSTIFMTPDHTAFLSAGSMATSLPGAFAETLGGTTNRSVSSGSMNVVLPAAPSFTATAVSASQINLTWTGVAGATSYFVDQWTGSAWTQVASLGSGSTSYAVNGLSPNTTYYFEVAASNAAGTTWANYQGATTFQNTVAVDHPAAATAYSPVSGSLFGASGPSYLDVRQGAVGDCWLMASLAEVAARDPSDIRNMFTDLGSTTESGSTVELYKVRFFNGAGVPEYVTVDTELPSGGDYYDQPVNGVLWVALAEKAYGEANGAGIVTTQYVGSDSYAALNGGDPAWALQAITGKSANGFAINPANIAAAWNAGQLIVLGSSPNAGDNLIVGDSTGTHAYAVVGYVPSSSEPFELYNPWGLSSVLDHTMEFNGNRVYDGPFLCDSSLISQDFNSQFIGTGAAPGLDDHGNTMAPVIVAPEVAPPMPLVLTQVPDKARVALHQDLALDALQQHDFDLSWVA